jgi:SAM-dependent methyltransferase
MEERGAWQEASEIRAEVAADSYSNFWDDFFYARALLYAGQHADAQPLIIELTELSDKPPVWMLKADLLERTENFSGALEAWEEAGKGGGPAYWCLFGRARSLYQLRRYDEAEKVMAEALLLPDRESTGTQFAETIEAAKAPAGALVSLALEPDPRLAPFATDALLKELLARLRAGEKVRTSEQSIAWADELNHMLAGQIDIHENRFSNRRLEDHFASFFTNLKVKPSIRNASFLDVGSGSHNPLALGMLFVLLGARRAFAADLQPIQDEKRAALALARIADILLTDPGRIVRDFAVLPEDVRKQLEGFDLAALRTGNIQGVDSSRLKLLVGSASRFPLEDGSIDVITSNSFFEHLEDPDEIIREMARITAPGGLGIHNIDGADHAIYGDPDVHPLSFLHSTDRGMVNGSNRIRPLEFPKRFEKLGFSLQQFIPLHTISIDADLRNRFAAHWRKMPDEMLQVVRATLVVKRKDDRKRPQRRKAGRQG